MGGGVFNWEFTSPPSGSEAPNPALAEIGVTVNKFQKVKLDVITNNTVGFDDRTGFAIDFVPGAANLGSQPTAQRPKMLTEALAVMVRTADALQFRQGFVGHIGAACRPVATTAMSRFFANDFVHVGTHIFGLKKVCGPRARKAAAL